ncbi:MAG: ABC-type transport auxiliary lipoprotein family protein [Rickettsiales bacterium]|jgi:cholesterol transport system auxiliary component
MKIDIRLWPKAVLATAFAGFLAGCSIPIPGGGEPPRLYVLTPKSTFPGEVPRAEWQVLIETPIAAAGLSTARIPLQDSPIELRYYTRAKWTDFAPKMVQTLMVESFENSRKIVGVGREQIGLRADFILKTELREFQAEYKERLPQDVSTMSASSEPPAVRVRINAKLVKMPRREIIASETFERKIVAESNTMEAIIGAFDESLGKVLKAIVIWTLENGEKHKPERLTSAAKS